MENKDQQDNSETKTPSETDVSEPVKKTARQPRGRGLSFISKFFITLSFALACLAVGCGYYLYIEQQERKVSVAELKQQLALLQSKQEAQAVTSTDLSRQTSALNGRLNKLRVQQTRLQGSISGIARRGSKHWMAAEADYLVEMAGRKLWLEQDPTTAWNLLKSADAQIAKMADPSLLPLRKALAQDMAQVKSVKRPDISGTVYEIDSVITELDQLPLNQAKPASVSEPDDHGLSDSIKDWHANLDKTWRALIADFVKIRKRQTDLAPLLSPQQSWYLTENIKNKLMQAQLALYRSDDVNFKRSMRLARKWVYEYFDLKSDATQNVLSSIDSISAVSVHPVAIHKFHSLPLLEQLMTFGEINKPEETGL